MAGERIVQIIQDASRNGLPPTSRTDLVWGTVQSADPIKIQVDSDQNLILDETFLKLSPLCLEKTFDIPQWQTQPASGPPGTPHFHAIEKHTKVVVWRGLKAGDRVIMLRVAGGNLFYVLQREGDL